MTEDAKRDVKEILEQMISGEKNLIKGCAELNRFLMVGYDFIYWDFEEYYQKLQQYPQPAQYHLWEKRKIEQKLKELDLIYRERIIILAKKLLKELK